MPDSTLIRIAYADIGTAIAGFAAFHPVAAGLCTFALIAVATAGLRAFMRRTARTEAWEFIARDREICRQQDMTMTLTHRDTISRQFNGA